MKREMSEIAGRIVGKICACRLHPAYAGLLPAVGSHSFLASLLTYLSFSTPSHDNRSGFWLKIQRELQ